VVYLIDIESEVFTEVKSVIPEGTTISGEFQKTPSAFPFVSVEQKDNPTYEKTQTDVENHATPMYEINVYSNKIGTKKIECKAIMDNIDTKMQSLGFTRKMCEPMPNLEDATIYRITARYSAVVSKNKTIYRR
jgi:hypothetical protein